MHKRVFLGRTSTKLLGKMCLAQGPQHSDADEAQTWTHRSRVKHSTTEPLCSLNFGHVQVEPALTRE